MTRQTDADLLSSREQRLGIAYREQALRLAREPRGRDFTHLLTDFGRRPSEDRGDQLLRLREIAINLAAIRKNDLRMSQLQNDEKGD